MRPYRELYTEPCFGAPDPAGEKMQLTPLETVPAEIDPSLDPAKRLLPSHGLPTQNGNIRALEAVLCFGDEQTAADAGTPSSSRCRAGMGESDPRRGLISALASRS